MHKLQCPSCGSANLIFPYPFRIVLDNKENPMIIIPFELSADFLLDACTTCEDCGYSGGIDG